MATEVDTSASLDDFFAKKDKKKTKKSKVLSELNALSQSEEKPKKKKSAKEKSSASGANAESGPHQTGADESEKASDEWVEIEEQADTDYSGLKIQSLRLEEREAAMKEEANADDEDAAKNGGGAHDGPWKKIEQPVLPESHTEVVSEVKEATPPSSGGKYVPPSVRAAQRQQQQMAAAPLRKRNNKLAPDVNDQESFPTLGGGGKGVSGRPGVDAPKSYTSLHLQNKWDSLSGGGSSEP